MAKVTKATAAAVTPAAATMIAGVDDDAKQAVLARIQSLGFTQVGKAGTVCYVEPGTDADYAGMVAFQRTQLGPVPDARDLALVAALHKSIGVPDADAKQAVNDAIKSLTHYTCSDQRKFTSDHNPKWNQFRNRKRPAILVLWFATGLSPAASSAVATPASDAAIEAFDASLDDMLKRLS